MPAASGAPRSVRESMRKRLIDLLCLCLPLALLLAVHITGPGAPTWALAIAWVLLTALAWYGLWSRALSRRRAFLNAYFQDHSWWRMRLRGGPLLAARQLLQAMLLTLVLLVAVVRLDDSRVWQLLLLNLPVLVLLHVLIGRLLAGHVSARFRTELVWRVVLVMNFLLLFPALVLLAMHASYPELGEGGRRQGVWIEMVRQDAASEWLLNLMQLAAAKDAVGWWLGQQLLPGLGGPVFQIGGWLIILAAEGLFLWSYLLVCAGVLEIARHRRRQRSGDASETCTFEKPAAGEH
ncbi:MAG: hypothetical protein LAT50_07980 [Ectothiorhodospiraceae bacterium]|nr:hypothetical protein [Ectothiorhodospiraceae bacterium]